MTPFNKLAVLGTLLTAFAIAPLSAALLVEETFDYAGGSSIHGKSGGFGFTNNWAYGKHASGTGAVTTVGGGIEITGERSTWANRGLAISATSTPSFYFSYDLSSSAAPGFSANSFLDALVFRSGSTTVFQSGMYYHYLGDIRMRGSAGGSDAYISPVGTAVGTVYKVVGKFTFDDGNGNASLSLWVNPAGEASAPSFTKTWASSITSISQIVVQRYDDNARAAGSSSVFDDIRIGTDWASLTPASPIPEPSTAAGLAGAAGLLFAATRRRR